MISYKMLVKQKKFMVLIQVSKIPTLFFILMFLGQKTKWFFAFW